MRIYIAIILLISALFGSENACKKPNKFNIGATPFYANRNQIDSMIDATGYMVEYKYDNNGRVIESKNTQYGISVYSYQSNDLYSAYESSSGLTINFYDNSEIDSMIFSNGSGYIMRNVFKYNEGIDVFEHWRDRSNTEPNTYDSIKYFDTDSLFHYRSIIYGLNKYEYSEGCKSDGNKCNCNLIAKSDNYPIYISLDPIYEYDEGKLIARKGAGIYYSKSNYSSSSIGNITSSSSMTSSSSITSSLFIIQKQVVEKYQNEYNLNGRLIKGSFE